MHVSATSPSVSRRFLLGKDFLKHGKPMVPFGARFDFNLITSRWRFGRRQFAVQCGVAFPA
jgi:hypothetical protein